MSLVEDVEKIENKVKKIEQETKDESFAMELLKDQRKQNKRLFVVLIIVLIMWFLTIGYLVYILNDTGTYTETTSQEVKDINSVGGNIINKGNTYGDNKANNN